MFLISKIVRGRRLLHELEQQEKDEAAAAIDAANSISQVSRRLAARHRRSSPNPLEDIEMEVQPGPSSAKNRRRKTTCREKTESVDSSLDSGDRMNIRRTSSMPSIVDNVPGTGEAAVFELKHYDYGSKLNKLQRRSLRFTWHRLQTRNGGKRVENVFEEVFDRLVRYLPQIRDIFTTRMFLCAMSRNEIASLRDHAKVTVRMIDTVIKNLDVEKTKRTDTATPLDPKIIGRAHGPLRPYGMTGQYWEKLGETIIDVVLAQEAVRDLPGAGQAWVILTACLVDQLRAGFDENRSMHSVFPKQSTVLHHATRHMHAADTPSTPPSQEEQRQQMPQQFCEAKRDSVNCIARGVERMAFAPLIRGQSMEQSNHNSRESPLNSSSGSTTSCSIKSCPLASRDSIASTSELSASDQPIPIT